MVLGIIDYCRNNAIVPYGYSHSFVMNEITGVNHKRIVIRNVHRYYNQTPLRSTIVIEYELHRIDDNGEDLFIRNTFGIDEEEYHRLTDR